MGLETLGKDWRPLVWRHRNTLRASEMFLLKSKHTTFCFLENYIRDIKIVKTLLGRKITVPRFSKQGVSLELKDTNLE